MLFNHALRTIVTAAGLAALLASAPARAELHVTVDQGIAKPLPIAIPDFSAPSAADVRNGLQEPLMAVDVRMIVSGKHTRTAGVVRGGSGCR